MRRRIYCIVVASFVSLYIFAFLPELPDKLHIMSYNIFNGFEHGDSLQTENFLRFIKAQNTDILAFQELVDIDANELSELANQYGHKYSAILKEEGYPVGISSKFPIEVIHKQVQEYWHGMIHVRTAGLDIIVTHFSPFDLKFRLKEVHYFLNISTKTT